MQKYNQNYFHFETLYANGDISVMITDEMNRVHVLVSMIMTIVVFLLIYTRNQPNKHKVLIRHGVFSTRDYV